VIRLEPAHREEACDCELWLQRSRPSACGRARMTARLGGAHPTRSVGPDASATRVPARRLRSGRSARPARATQNAPSAPAARRHPQCREGCALTAARAIRVPLGRCARTCAPAGAASFALRRAPRSRHAGAGTSVARASARACPRRAAPRRAGRRAPISASRARRPPAPRARSAAAGPSSRPVGRAPPRAIRRTRPRARRAAPASAPRRDRFVSSPAQRLRTAPT